MRRSTRVSPCSTPPRSTGRARASGSSAACSMPIPPRAGKAVIATKFMPSPWKLNVHASLLSALRRSLDRLGLKKVGLYQIHGPISLRSHAALAEALATAVHGRLVDAVGVSNYSAKETRSIARELGRRDVLLATNQIEFSLLRRAPETTGLLAVCKELGVLPLAYSPLGQGRLSGKYSASNPPPGKRGFSAHPMQIVDVVVDELRSIGEKHGGKLPSQVALNWIVAKGAVPIPGAKNRQQAEENAGALGWNLDEDDLERLDRAALDRDPEPAQPVLAARLRPATWRRRRLGNFRRRRHLGDRQRSLSGAHWL